MGKDEILEVGMRRSGKTDEAGDTGPLNFYRSLPKEEDSPPPGEASFLSPSEGMNPAWPDETVMASPRGMSYVRQC